MSDQQRLQNSNESQNTTNETESPLKEFTKQGAAGYLQLGTTVASLLDDGEHKDLLNAITKQSSERKKQNRSLAGNLLSQHVSKAIVQALDERKHDLWIDAVAGGMKTNFDDYRRATNEDVATLIDMVEAQSVRIDETKKHFEDSTSFFPTLKNGIVSGFAFGLLLGLVGFIDNPLSETAKVLFGIN